MKATALAPANVGLIKYWGKKDEILKLPQNGSIALNLSGLTTTTTVEFDGSLVRDTVEINGGKQIPPGRVCAHLDLIRKKAGINEFARVVSVNSFPDSTGLSSSSSGFAALTLAACTAAGLSLPEKELSVIARQGSGSACRSIPSGFVEWLKGNTGDTSYAYSLFPPAYWELVDIVAVVSSGKKEVSSTQGQKLVDSSPFYLRRLEMMKEKLERMKEIIKVRDFTAFGEMIEAEALEMHAVMLTSKPSLIYWTSGTLEMMKLVLKWRSAGLPVYFTVNTGQDIHLFCEAKNIGELKSRLKQTGFVRKTIVNYPSEGARIINEHLF